MTSGNHSAGRGRRDTKRILIAVWLLAGATLFLALLHRGAGSAEGTGPSARLSPGQRPAASPMAAGQRGPAIVSEGPPGQARLTQVWPAFTNVFGNRLQPHAGGIRSRAEAQAGAGRKAETALNEQPRLTTLKGGDLISLPLFGAEEVRARVNHSATDARGWTRIGGELLGAEPGSFFVTSSPSHTSGLIILPGLGIAYQLDSTAQGKLSLRERRLSEVVCLGIPRHKVPPQPARAAATAPPPALSSRPAAISVIYLDFDGETVTDPDWNDGDTIVAQSPGLTNSQITDIWRRVREDFWPFDIDITTSLARYNSAPVGRRMRCIVTPTDTAAPGAGGVAYIDSFSGAGDFFSDDIPCWVFNSDVVGISEAISHEIGHTLGLRHDGDSENEYYEGHGSGAVGWAPIMGVGYYQPVVQWSKGEYSGASNQQDDLAIITSSLNAFGNVPDDAGNTTETAASLNAPGGVVDQAGVVTNASDSDYYIVSAPAGTVSIAASPDPYSPNLDILLELRDSAGAVVATSNPDGALNATLNQSISAGVYYIVVRGTGRGNVLGDGYSSYGSIGAYTLAGTVPTGPQTPFIVSGSAQATLGQPFTYQILATGTPTSYGATGLPPGLVLDSGTGIISGTPTQAGVFPVELTAVNALGTGGKNISISVITGYAQNFDGVSAPALPVGWTTSASGAQQLWTTSVTNASSAPNSAFSPSVSSTGTNALVSPILVLGTGAAELQFKNKYDLETDFDGGLLEIRIGSGAFADIVVAGGSFTSNGYVGTLDQDGPLGAVDAWTGDSGGSLLTVVSLPAAAAGQTVQFRWRCGCDQSVSEAGWWIDDIFCTNASLLTGPEIDVAATGAGSLSDGDSVDFGSVSTTSTSAPIVFTITNSGTANLTNLSISKSGPQADDFDVSELAVSELAPNTSALVTVTFAPSAAGNRAALLAINSNDTNESPFEVQLTGSGVGPLTIGPDSFGYTATNDLPYSFQDIAASGTVILPDQDDSAASAPIGFTFSFYGSSYTSASVSSNGLITFIGSYTAFQNVDLLTANLSRPVICALWDDWYTNKTAADKVYYQTVGSPGNRVFTVQWVVNPSGSASATSEVVFQCQLFEATGKVQLNLADLQTGSAGSDFGGSATVGIQNTGGNSSGEVLQWSFNSPLTGNSSIVFTPPTVSVPEIVVHNGPTPASPELSDGQAQSIDFGVSPVGSPLSRSFVIANAGAAALQVSNISVPGGFSLVNAPASAIAPAGTHVFQINLTAAAAGTFSGSVILSSNDADEAAFDFPVLGTILSAQQQWRLTYFGTTDDVDNAADLFDFDRDGLVNLLEFGLGTHPTQPSTDLGRLSKVGGTLEFFYTRSTTAAGILTFSPVWNDGLNPLQWSGIGVSQTVISDDGTTQQVKASLPAGTGTSRFVRLRVSSQ